MKLFGRKASQRGSSVEFNSIDNHTFEAIDEVSRARAISCEHPKISLQEGDPSRPRRFTHLLTHGHFLIIAPAHSIPSPLTRATRNTTRRPFGTARTASQVLARPMQHPRRIHPRAPEDPSQQRTPLSTGGGTTPIWQLWRREIGNGRRRSRGFPRSHRPSLAGETQPARLGRWDFVSS